MTTLPYQMKWCMSFKFHNNLEVIYYPKFTIWGKGDLEQLRTHELVGKELSFNTLHLHYQSKLILYTNDNNSTPMMITVKYYSKLTFHIYNLSYKISLYKHMCNFFKPPTNPLRQPLSFLHIKKLAYGPHLRIW